MLRTARPQHFMRIYLTMIDQDLHPRELRSAGFRHAQARDSRLTKIYRIEI